MSQIASGQIVLGKCASFLGIIQGITWCIMALICIIEFGLDEPPEEENIYKFNFNSGVYASFLDRNTAQPLGKIVTPVTFVIFSVIYIVLNLIWVYVSTKQFQVLLKMKLKEIPLRYKYWALITWLICLVDFVMVVLLGLDFGQLCPRPWPCKEDLEKDEQDCCSVTIFPVLVIAAKGFILWIVNAFIAYRLLYNGKKIRVASKNEEIAEEIASTKDEKIEDLVPKEEKIEDLVKEEIETVGAIPRVNPPSLPSLYSQQQFNLESGQFWGLNLRVAMDERTPPTSPSAKEIFTDTSPDSKDRHFFNE